MPYYSLHNLGCKKTASRSTGQKGSNLRLEWHHETDRNVLSFEIESQTRNRFDEKTPRLHASKFWKNQLGSCNSQKC